LREVGERQVGRVTAAEVSVDGDRIAGPGVRRGPAVTHRYQVRLPGEALFFQQNHRVGAVRGGAIPLVARQRRPITGFLAAGSAFVDARMRDLLHNHPASPPF
jgi:hypothetical protein